MKISRRAALASGLSFAALGSVRAATAITVIKAADGRDVRVSIWNAVGPRRGLILFSHGAMSMPEKYELLLTPWAQAGFEILAPLHIDSVDHPDHAHLNPAAIWPGRIEDMRALSTFVSAPSYIAAGHSFGGLVALTMGGASGIIPPGTKGPLRHKQAKCVVALSPPPPVPTLITAEGYSTLAVPAIIQTGTIDNFGTIPWQTHLTAYDVAPPKDKYGLVLDGVGHYFGGLICEPTMPGPPQTEQLAIAVDLSTTFMEAYGLKDSKAMARLEQAVGDHGMAHLTRK